MKNQSILSQQPRNPKSVGPLHNCVPGEARDVMLMFDATLRRPLRLRDTAGVKLSLEHHSAAQARLAAVDALLSPLSVVYVLAKLQGEAQAGPALDAARLTHLPRVLFAHAAAVDALQGVALELRPSVRVVPGDGAARYVDAELRVCVGDATSADPDVSTAVKAYADWAAKAWAHAVGSTLAPWLLGSGVREIRLAGSIAPDRRQQLAVLAGRCPVSHPGH